MPNSCVKVSYVIYSVYLYSEVLELGKAILCVDDEKIVLISIVEQLRERFQGKYIYEMAMSAEEALTIIDELVEDGVDVILVISDWLMRGMKGDEFLIQVHEKYPGTLNIMLTGQATADAVNRVKENGALDAFVSKPWDKDLLMNKINMLLEGKHNNISY